MMGLVPMQVIWMAAHMDRNLKRQQITDASIAFSVDAIMQPQVSGRSKVKNGRQGAFSCRLCITG